MAYLLDADVFISAKRHHYRFIVCPGFWEWLLHANGRGRVFSIDKVQRELKNGTDELAAWAEEQSTSFFLEGDAQVIEAAERVSAWAHQQHYEPQAISEFFRSADYWLVAHAISRGWKVITHEVSAPESKKKIKLPDACAAVGVATTSPFQMLEDEGARFVLGVRL
ncbi:MAG: DUF4411 family protein [Acidobacteria bacterium]|nr:DUF4411 family protein [Acidobacteriota bacterium]MBI3655399.1 DUF4411 family protein [Acidobacteriota bacterium]